LLLSVATGGARDAIAAAPGLHVIENEVAVCAVRHMPLYMQTAPKLVPGTSAGRFAGRKQFRREAEVSR
jgi:hypothetical protein